MEKKKKLGRPPGTVKRVTVSTHIRQDVFMQLARISAKLKISLSRLIADLLESDPAIKKGE